MKKTRRASTEVKPNDLVAVMERGIRYTVKQLATRLSMTPQELDLLSSVAVQSLHAFFRSRATYSVVCRWPLASHPSGQLVLVAHAVTLLRAACKCAEAIVPMEHERARGVYRTRERAKA
ncbi:hypothetical protein [Paraburkholderia youngii]|uniref:hypothetical protein n=1 Tax=Paraburkholderia youngii TaxID=2782701 RepID=UPI003D198321